MNKRERAVASYLMSDKRPDEVNRNDIDIELPRG